MFFRTAVKFFEKSNFVDMQLEHKAVLTGICMNCLMTIDHQILAKGPIRFYPFQEKTKSLTFY